MAGLKGKRCLNCGSTMYPPHSRCPKCKEVGFEDVELREGKLASYTILHAAPPGVEKPLFLGIVEFEGGVRAIGQLVLGQHELGESLVAEEAKLREKDGRVYMGFRFVRKKE